MCVFVHVQSIFVVLLNNLAFLSTLQSELAAKRIGKVLNVNQQNEQLMEEYEQMASTVSAPLCVLACGREWYMCVGGSGTCVWEGVAHVCVGGSGTCVWEGVASTLIMFE